MKSQTEEAKDPIFDNLKTPRILDGLRPHLLWKVFENSVFLRNLRASKPDPIFLRSQPIMTRTFLIVFGQQVVTKYMRQWREGDMRHAVRESASERFHFLRGLPVVVEFVAPENLSRCRAELSYLMVGTRENATCTLRARRVVAHQYLSPRNI